MATPRDSIDQIDAMRMGVDYRVPVKVRGFTCLFRPLSMQETVEVASAVQNHFMSLPAQSRNSLTENTLLAQKSLQLASTSDVGQTDFQLTEIICQRMTPDEIQFLWKQYCSAIDKANPSLELASAEEMGELVEALKKSPKESLASALIGLSFSQLVSLGSYLLTQGD